MNAHPDQISFLVESEETALLRRLVAAQGRTIEELKKRIREADPFARRRRDIRTKKFIRRCRCLPMSPGMRNEADSLYHELRKAVGMRK